ncbi:hypothetical protein GCM10023193_27590 [Planotetraspora kaengkrachanensis]|uniref:Uncharacterized protein n=1 Tax=Planotetraspora kaengkrachanensis TaxID=575193 RepID=A0A8J3PQK6_9ACTN|nr:hypothetical protein Pka01_13390 [Planotetraspora kaengkrachanensis]
MEWTFYSQGTPTPPIHSTPNAQDNHPAKAATVPVTIAERTRLTVMTANATSDPGRLASRSSTPTITANMKMSVLDVVQHSSVLAVHDRNGSGWSAAPANKNRMTTAIATAKAPAYQAAMTLSPRRTGTGPVAPSG